MRSCYDGVVRRYLDCIGGIVTVSVGHCHPVLNRRIAAQADRLWHTTQMYLTPFVAKYCQKLAKTFKSDKLTSVFLVNSGRYADSHDKLETRSLSRGDMLIPYVYV